MKLLNESFHRKIVLNNFLKWFNGFRRAFIVVKSSNATNTNDTNTNDTNTNDTNTNDTKL
jgi:hypothetical protein